MRFAAILFDAYGTLLDVHGVAERAGEFFPGGGDGLARLWRDKQLAYSWLRTLSGQYADFWQVTGDALDYAAAALGLELTAAARAMLMDEYLRLPLFADAGPTLEQLASGGPPLAVLSNGTAAMLDGAFGHAGARHYFTALISVDAAQAYKTAPAAYRLATERFGVSPGDLLLVSSNGWDVAGAAHFGFGTFWVNRTNAPIERLGVTPSGIGRSLAELPAWLDTL